MAKKRPRRRKRKYKTEDLLVDFRRLPNAERVLLLKRLQERLRIAGTLLLIFFALYCLAQLC